jgi:serine/threonine protein kinase
MQPAPTEETHALQRRARVYMNPDCAGDVDLQALLDLPLALAALPGRTTRQPGRTTSWEWPADRPGGPPLMVRLYAHGGLLGGLLGDRFIGTARMLDEFRIHLHALRSGVPTSVPVAVRVERRGPFVVAHYVTRKVVNTVDLLDFCAGERALSAGQRRRLAAAVARAIAAMHRAGILHADLNLKNLLVRDPLGKPEVFIIDFDKARLRRELSLRARLGNLRRLDRSAAKWAASRRLISPLDRLRVLHAYLSHFPQRSKRKIR